MLKTCEVRVQSHHVSIYPRHVQDSTEICEISICLEQSVKVNAFLYVVTLSAEWPFLSRFSLVYSKSRCKDKKKI